MCALSTGGLCTLKVCRVSARQSLGGTEGDPGHCSLHPVSSHMVHVFLNMDEAASVVPRGHSTELQSSGGKQSCCWAIAIGAKMAIADVMSCDQQTFYRPGATDIYKLIGRSA